MIIIDATASASISIPSTSLTPPQNVRRIRRCPNQSTNRHRQRTLSRTHRSLSQVRERVLTILSTGIWNDKSRFCWSRSPKMLLPVFVRLPRLGPAFYILRSRHRSTDFGFSPSYSTFRRSSDLDLRDIVSDGRNMFASWPVLWKETSSSDVKRKSIEVC